MDFFCTVARHKLQSCNVTHMLSNEPKLATKVVVQSARTTNIDYNTREVPFSAESLANSPKDVG